MSQIISVEGIECYAYHGCLQEEAKIGCRYSVDVWVKADVSASFKTDNINDTIDYSMINKVVNDQMAIRSNLIEHVAWRIFSALKEKINFYESLEICVTKYNPPVNGNVNKTSFSIKE